MFGVESKELLIILFAALILFGPKRIPEVARALGKGVGDIRDALSGIERDVRQAADTLTAPETRPVPGVGAIAAHVPGESPASGVLEGGRAAAGAMALEGAPGGSEVADGDAMTTPRPEAGPGPGPFLAG